MRKSDQRGDAAGASDRVEQLFRCHHAAVVAYVRRRAPADLVDDVVGETFLVAWRRLDRMPDNPLPWLLAVARNVVATQERGVLRRRALTLRLAGMHPVSEPGTVDRADGRVASALARLAPKDREALTLIAWDGLQPHEAAVVLGEAPGTFRVRLHRARGRLRRLLDEPAEPPELSAIHRIRVEEVAHD
jgi:RNA polymerase sigma-70 factor (ECF subfamily)